MQKPSRTPTSGFESTGCRAGLALLLLAGSGGVYLQLRQDAAVFFNRATVITVCALAALVLAAVLALSSRQLFLRRIAAAFGLAYGAGVLFARALGAAIPGFLTVPALEWGLGALLCACAAGVLLRRRGARWVALGMGGVGLLSTGINLVQFVGSGDPRTSVFACWALGCAALLATLISPALAEDDHLAPGEQVWKQRNPMVTSLRLAALSAVVAAPMLLVYAFVQAEAAGPAQTFAPYLAGWMAIATWLTLRGRVLGALLLAAAGIALGVESALLYYTIPAADQQVAFYYLVFWLPCAAIALLAGVLTTRASLRFLRV